MSRAGMFNHANNETATSGGHGFSLQANNTPTQKTWRV
jgi:hypothetical protein